MPPATANPHGPPRAPPLSLLASLKCKGVLVGHHGQHASCSVDCQREACWADLAGASRANSSVVPSGYIQSNI